MDTRHADGVVITIGVFDGVHRGHQALIAAAREQADLRGLPLVAMTFDPHPLAVIGPKRAPTSLATLEHRAELLRRAGADVVEVLAFDEDTAAMSPQDFVADVLVRRLGARAVVVGADFRFGHRAAGTLVTLEDEGARAGFSVVGVPLAGDHGQRWSSTATRALIEAGEVAAAAVALGRPYRIDGEVVHGDHRGRELGFPTANLAASAIAPVQTAPPTVPSDGVYAGWVRLLDSPDAPAMPSAISVGTNPTFDGLERRVEAHVLGRDDLDLYGQAIGVEIVDRLRGQLRFDGADALVAQMCEDVVNARAVLGLA
ncbi:MAG: bifunctional riboflavin kinase/FAD synthetase [Candidatus Nanopelagicales bacterium]|jgi:riboflavin kinase/FMN adenylyltransferase